MKTKGNVALQTKEAGKNRQKQNIRLQPKTLSKQYIKPSVIICLIAAISIVFSFLIFSMVQLNESNSQAQKLMNELNVAKSENVRLNTEIGEKMSLQEVAKKAKELGLAEKSGAQTNYIGISGGNVIEIPDKNHSGENLNKLEETFVRFLEYLRIF